MNKNLLANARNTSSIPGAARSHMLWGDEVTVPQ